MPRNRTKTKQPTTAPRLDGIARFLAFADTLPNRNKRLADLLTPDVKAATTGFSLFQALRVAHTLGPASAKNAKFAARPNKGGRKTGTSNREWGEPPPDVGRYYTDQRAYPENKREAARSTWKSYFPDEPIPEGRKLDKLVAQLEKWSKLDWDEWKYDAWTANHYNEWERGKSYLVDEPEPEPEPKPKKRRHDPLGAQFVEGSVGGRVDRSRAGF